MSHSRHTRLGPGQFVEEGVREDAVEVGAEQDPAQVEGRQAQRQAQRLGAACRVAHRSASVIVLAFMPERHRASSNHAGCYHNIELRPGMSVCIDAIVEHERYIGSELRSVLCQRWCQKQGLESWALRSGFERGLEAAPEGAGPGEQQVRPRGDGVVHVDGEAQPRRPRRALALHVTLRATGVKHLYT